jgi:glutaredoxin
MVAAQQCSAHHLAAREDGTCVLCRREPPEARVTLPRRRTGVLIGVALALLLVGSFFRVRKLEADVQAVAHPTQSAAAGPVSIELWGAPWCGGCRRAKAWLDAKGIPYVEYNIDADPDARARLRGFTNVRSIPAWKIDDQILTGFSEEGITNAIAQASAKRARAQAQAL